MNDEQNEVKGDIKKSPADRAAESVARATWVIAGLPVATIGVGVLQWLVYSAQLEEMKGGGADTHALAEAAKAQAAAVSEQYKILEEQLRQMRIYQRAFVYPAEESWRRQIGR